MLEKELEGYVHGMVVGVAGNPGDVRVKVTPFTSRCVVEIQTNVEDIGHVIGRRGVVIQSIRALAEAFCGRRNLTVTVDYLTEKERPPANRRG